MAEYTDDLALIVRYDGTKAAFDAVKSNYLGKVVFIYGSESEVANQAGLVQAIWVSDANGGRYLDMANVEYISNNLTHISGITVDGKTYYPASGGGAITLTGANGIAVTVNTTTGAVTFDGKALSDALIGTTANGSNTSTHPDTIKGAKAYTDKVAGDLKGTKATGDTTAETIRGAKDYADAKVSAAKTELKGTSSDTVDSETIAGAKKYADEVAASKASAAKDEAIQASKDYVDPLLANKADLEGGKIKESQLPDFILGQMIFGGVITGGGANQMVVSVSSTFKDKYNITTDTVTIPKSDADKYEGTYFIASDSSGNVLGLDTVVGDWVVSNGSPVWYKIDNTDAVTTVVGQTGAITAAQIDEAIANIASTTRKLATASEVNGKYTKPAGGIPATDMAENVQKNLDRASRAVVGVDSKGDFLDVTAESNTLEETVVYVEAKTAEITSETATTNGLATVADIRAYLAARLSVKVVS